MYIWPSFYYVHPHCSNHPYSKVEGKLVGHQLRLWSYKNTATLASDEVIGGVWDIRRTIAAVSVLSPQ